MTCSMPCSCSRTDAAMPPKPAPTMTTRWCCSFMNALSASGLGWPTPTSATSPGFRPRTAADQRPDSSDRLADRAQPGRGTALGRLGVLVVAASGLLERPPGPPGVDLLGELDHLGKDGDAVAAH